MRGVIQSPTHLTNSNITNVNHPLFPNCPQMLRKSAQLGKVEPMPFFMFAADVNHKEQGLTPLQEAVARGHDEVVQYLVLNGATVEATVGDEGQGSVLHEAVLLWDSCLKRKNVTIDNVTFEKELEECNKLFDVVTALLTAMERGNLRLRVDGNGKVAFIKLGVWENDEVLVLYT